MPDRRILVIANRTVASDALADALAQRAGDEGAAVTIVVPGPVSGREEATGRLELALGRLRAAGVQADGRVGADSPLVAAEEEYDARHYDEIVVATVQGEEKGWQAAGLPGHIGRRTGAIVHTVGVPAEQAAALPPHVQAEHHSLLEGMLRELHVDTNRDTGPLRG
jgi:hypothetical protein